MSPRVWFRTVGLSALLIVAVTFASVRSDEAKGKKYALLVGVTEYDSPHFSTLNYTANDALQMEQALKKAGFASIRVLTDKSGAKNAPTAGNVRAALKTLLAKKTKHDTVLVGLAGHGMQLEVTDKEGNNPRSYSYFCPRDASLQGISHSTGRSEQLILLDDLFRDLGECDAGHRLALLDACRNDGKVKAAKRARLDVNKVTVPDGVGVLFSCGRGQFAFETEKLGKGHGVFFYHVIEGLNGEAADKEGAVTWDGLSAYVKRQVSRYVAGNLKMGAKQTPASAGNQEGESVLAVVKAGGGKDNARPNGKDQGRVNPKQNLVEKNQLWSGTYTHEGNILNAKLKITNAGPQAFEADWNGTLPLKLKAEITSVAKDGTLSLKLRFYEGDNLFSDGTGTVSGKKLTGNYTVRKDNKGGRIDLDLK
jgi:uncharacterized caspase-like protein